MGANAKVRESANCGSLMEDTFNTRDIAVKLIQRFLGASRGFNLNLRDAARIFVIPVLGLLVLSVNVAKADLYVPTISQIGVFDNFSGSTITPNFGSPPGYGYAAALDASGNLYVSGANAIKKYSPSGVLTLTISDAGFVPLGIAVDGSGNIYVSDYFGGTLKKFGPAGNLLITASGLNVPAGVALDASGNVYVAEYNSGDVIRFNSSLTSRTTFVATGSQLIVGIAIDASGNVYVSDYDDDTVSKYDSAGAIVSAFGTAGTISGFISPAGLALDGAGNLFVAANGAVQQRNALTGASIPLANTIQYNGIVYSLAVAPYYITPPTQTINATVNLPITSTSAYVASSVGSSFTGTVSYAVSPSLPLGLSFDSQTGVISGTPSVGQSSTNYTVVAAGVTSGYAISNVTITVQQSIQATLTAIASPSNIFVNGTSTLSTSGGSGTGAVSYQVTSGGSYCSISGSTLTGTSVGSCQVTATKQSDNTYLSATSSAITVSVGLAPQGALTVVASPTNIQVSGTSNLTITGGAGTGAVTYSVLSGPCSVSGTTATATGAGICVIAATKAADANYAAAVSTTNAVITATAPSTPEVPAPVVNTPPTIASPTSNGVSPVAGVSSTGATVGAKVSSSDSLTYVSFQFGKDTSYGAVVAAGVVYPNTLNPIPVYANLTGLSPNTTYHVRVVATNAYGTVYGQDVTFTTPPEAPVVSNSPAPTAPFVPPVVTPTVSSSGPVPGLAVTQSGSLTTGTLNSFNSNAAGTTYASSTAPTHGTVQVDPNGTYTYTPSLGYEGLDTFGYTACHAGTCSPGTVTVAVAQATTAATRQTGTGGSSQLANVNDGITWNGLPASSSRYQGTLYVLGNTYNPNLLRSSVEGSASAVSLDPVTGNVMVQPNAPAGSYGFQCLLCLKLKQQSALNRLYEFFSIQSVFADSAVDVALKGTAPCVLKTLTVVVSHGVNPSNDTVNTWVNQGISGSVAENDGYPQGSVFSAVTQPAHGTLAFKADGGYSYLPRKGFKGVDTFQYQLCQAAPNTTTCARASVTLNVGINKLDQRALALSSSALTTSANKVVRLQVKGGDVKKNPTFSVVAQGAANCRISGNGANRTLKIKGDSGACLVTASRPGSVAYNPVTSNSVTVSLDR